MENKHHKTIVCSPKNFELVKNKFKSKKVVSDIYCDDIFVYYIRTSGKGILSIKIEDWSIWIPSEFPYFKKWRSKDGK